MVQESPAEVVPEPYGVLHRCRRRDQRLRMAKRDIAWTRVYTHSTGNTGGDS